MSVQLRPANLGEILDRTANLYRSRFLVFLGISAIPAATVLGFAAAVFLLSAWMSTADPKMVTLLATGMAAVLLLAIPVCLAIAGLGSAALGHAANKAYLEEPIGIREAYAAIWKQGWRYIGLLALQVLFLAVIPFVVWIVVVGVLAVMTMGRGFANASLSGGPTALLLLFGLGLVAYFLWMLLRLCMAFPASIVEQSGAWASLKRANLLSLGTRGRILVLYLLCGALSWIVSLVITVPVALVVGMIPQLNTPQNAQTTGTLFLFFVYGASFASQAFTKPVSGIAMMVFYYDQRIRREAFDVEWMMRQAGMIEPEPVKSAQWAPAAALGDRPLTEGGAQHNAAGGPS